MKCKKHLGIDIPCSQCVLDEYNYFKKENEKGKHNDLTEIEKYLRSHNLI